MEFLYMAIGMAVLLLLLLLSFIIAYRHRAAMLVRMRTDTRKCRDLNRAAGAFGFRYDFCQDIFCSLRNSWQRSMGYGRYYDEHAIGMDMVFDCEPLYFTYNKRSYLLEVWKGQYGMTTGAEIGFYVAEGEEKEHPEKLFYRSVSDEEMLPMRFVLKKQGRILMIRDEIHWWLTGFVLGEFSEREELKMDVTIGFLDSRMRNAFVRALLRAGYRREELAVNGRNVSFCFEKPRTLQPEHCKMHIRRVQRRNRRRCRRFFRVTRRFRRTIDRIDYLGMCFPHLYQSIGGMSRLPSPEKCRRIQKKCVREGYQ